MKKIKLFFLAFLCVCLGLTSFSSAGFENPNFSFGLFTGNTFTSLNDYQESNVDQTFQLGYELTDSNNNQLFYNVFNHQFNWSPFPSFSISPMAEMFFMEGGSIKIGGSTVCSIATISSTYEELSYNYIYSVDFLNFDLNSYLVFDDSNFGFDKQYSSFTIQNPGRCEIYITIPSGMGVWSLFDLFSFESSNIQYINLNGDVVSSYSGFLYQCLEDKNQLIGQVSTLSGSLSSCQSDLSNCVGGSDASLLACIDQKEQCESSLITLSGNYASLENMNSSLSSQLQECLENSSGSGDLICNKFDLFWSSENTDYSFPINNDLILPPGYKGFVNEGVLAIKKDSSLDSAYSIDDEDFQGIVSDFGKVFVFIFSGGLFVLFLFIIRKYFTSLFK